MKKVMFAAAVAASLGLFADGIQSANTVGYLTYQSGMGIENIGAAVAPINAAGEWTATSNIYDTAAVGGDVVMYLNPEIFDLDAYQFNGYDGSGNSEGWTYSTSDPNTGDPIYETIASFTLAKGKVTYCQPADGISGFTTAGEVESGSSATVAFETDGFFEFVNPFPKATTLGDLETFCEGGDVLMVLNFEIFDLDAYQFNGKTGNVSDGWTYSTSDPNTGDPIYETITDSSTVVLPVGQGGYFQPGDGGDRSWTVSL
jgi:hypothetical protein